VLLLLSDLFLMSCEIYYVALAFGPLQLKCGYPLEFASHNRGSAGCDAGVRSYHLFKESSCPGSNASSSPSNRMVCCWRVLLFSSAGVQLDVDSLPRQAVPPINAPPNLVVKARTLICPAALPFLLCLNPCARAGAGVQFDLDSSKSSCRGLHNPTNPLT
jgi:hypothetical protein